ncbi:recombinase RecQ, partial [Arthrobacter deserti]|nr:recombinase RecQ [Arthrobacter deserti]
SLARGLSEIGRLPYLGALALADGGPKGGPGGNSAFRLADVWNRFAVPEGGAGWFAGHPGPVLLVDDLADSRWTLTVAGRTLRAAGAAGVLPFALALKA